MEEQMCKFCFGALVAIFAGWFLMLSTPSVGQGFAPSGQALCYVDGVVNPTPQACANYLLQSPKSLQGGVIEDNNPTDVSTDLFVNSGSSAQPGITWQLGHGNGGVTCSSANTSCWVIEQPLILAASSGITGTGPVIWGGDTSSGTVIMTGSNFPGPLTYSPSGQLTASGWFNTTPAATCAATPIGSGSSITRVDSTGTYFGTFTGTALWPGHGITISGFSNNNVANAYVLTASATQFQVNAITTSETCPGTCTYAPAATIPGAPTTGSIYYLDLVQINNLNGPLGSPVKPVPGPTTPSGELAVTCPAGSNNDITITAPTTLTNPNTTAPGHLNYDADYAGCLSSTSGQEVCGCRVNKGSGVCSGTLPAGTPAAACKVNGNVDSDAGCLLGNPMILSSIPSLPRSTTAFSGGFTHSGAFAPPVDDLSSVAIVVGQSNSGDTGNDNSFGNYLSRFSILCGPAYPSMGTSSNLTPASATPSVVIWDREGEEASFIGQVGLAGPCTGAGLYITRGNSMEIARNSVES
jgi:hypothetical protein